MVKVEWETSLGGDNGLVSHHIDYLHKVLCQAVVNIPLPLVEALLHIEHMGCWIDAWVEDRVFKHNLGNITVWVVLRYVDLKPKDPLLVGPLPYEENTKPDQRRLGRGDAVYAW